MTQSELVTREYKRVLVTAIVCTVCFLLQAVLWIMGLSMEHNAWGDSDRFVYPWLFYCVPEIIPGMAIMLLLCFQSRHMRTLRATSATYVRKQLQQTRFCAAGCDTRQSFDNM